MTHSKTPLKGKTVSDLEFMTGAWRGEKEDDIFEEHWTSEIKNNKTGMFRWMKGDEIFVYEIMAFVENDGNLQLLLRHFDKSFTAWEEKETPLVFLLTELTDNKAVFISSSKPDGGFLQYELIDSKTLRFADLESDGSLSFELLFSKIY
ncbi:MAG: DUF6265 family protein [Candidatus Thorarchaeota archaeon]|jgi:hypothetical protein